MRYQESLKNLEALLGKQQNISDIATTSEVSVNRKNEPQQERSIS